jgi:hypothetical protein
VTLKNAFPKPRVYAIVKRKSAKNIGNFGSSISPVYMYTDIYVYVYVFIHRKSTDTKKMDLTLLYPSSLLKGLLNQSGWGKLKNASFQGQLIGDFVKLA